MAKSGFSQINCQKLYSLDQPNRSFQAYAISIEERTVAAGRYLVPCKEAMEYDA
jgi:hypothetical protein